MTEQTHNHRARLLVTFVVLVVGLSLLPQTLLAGSGELSVLKIPPVEGGDQAQVAVKWSGELPVTLQTGVASGDEGFIATAPAVELIESMTLLPHPGKNAGKPLTWRVVDKRSRTLAAASTMTRGAPTIEWQPDFIGPGLRGSPLVTAIYEDDLIVGGLIRIAGKHRVNSIARWDGNSWSALSGPSGTGLEGVGSVKVSSLAVFQGDLIVGGEFTTAGGVPVNNIARWDGSEWSALSGSGTGLNNSVNALTVWDGALIAGGSFSEADGQEVNFVARWDGTEWATLSGSSGTGVNAFVFALAVHDGDLIAGGVFTQAGGVAVNNIARWNGTDWSALQGPAGPGVDSVVYALTVFEGDLIAGGNFSEAGGLTVNHIARWDGTAWSALAGPTGTGMDGRVQALTVYDSELLAGGSFTEAGGLTVNRIARWDGSEWSTLSGPIDIGVNADVRTLSVHDGGLIAAGAFSEAGSLTVNSIARWDGSVWSILSDEPGTGIGGIGPASVLATSVYEGNLIAAGSFRVAGGLTVNRIARWDGSEWSALSGPSATGIDDLFSRVNALTLYEGELIAGGEFETAGGEIASNIARWDGAEWKALQGSSGEGLSDRVHALTTFDGDLIAGGFFDQAGGLAVNNIARWDGTEWSALPDPAGMGLDGTVFALTVHNSDLIAGGFFESAGGLTVNRVARWDGVEWTALSGPSGAGMNRFVRALAVYDGDLIAGGAFSEAGGTEANRIARWDGSRWSELSGSSGIGIAGIAQVYALTQHDGNLIAGGGFIEAGGVTVNSIAQWDGTDWSALPGPSGSGMDTTVQALTTLDGDLFAGGSFTLSGGVANWRLARYGRAALFSVGGTVDGLQGTGLVLQNNGTDDLAVSADGSFVFDTPLEDGSNYEVAVLTQPDNPIQHCVVVNGSGQLTGADITNVAVNCFSDFLFDDRFEGSE